jgi:hypothetical protein
MIRLSIAALVVALTMAVSPSRATTVNYDLNDTVGSSPSILVTGFIETDGKIGALSASDILNYDIVLTTSSASDQLTPASSTGSAIFGTALFTSSSGGLFFNFGGNGVVFFQNAGGGFSLCSSTSSTCDPTDTMAATVCSPGCTSLISSNLSGDVQIGATPAPPALAAFVGGLALLGLLLASRRRRSLRFDVG